MRILITSLIIFFNFILQTTIFQSFAVRGVFPNTGLIIVVSYALLRGRKEGCIVGVSTGLLFDIFFGTTMGFYTVLYLSIGFIIGRSQKNFYRENYLLPILFSLVATAAFESIHFATKLLIHREGNLLYFLLQILLPLCVYTAVITIPMYRVLFGSNEWLELKEKYKYRLF